MYLYGSGQPYACDMCKVRQIGIHPHVHAHTNVQPREYSCTCTCSLSLSLSPSLSPSISLSLSLSLSLSFYIYIYISLWYIAHTHTHDIHTNILQVEFPQGALALSQCVHVQQWHSTRSCTHQSYSSEGDFCVCVCGVTLSLNSCQLNFLYGVLTKW